MSHKIGLITAALWMGSVLPAMAQTTVQLPSFSYFTVNTTVLVPDRGSAFLGGSSHGAEGSSSRGIPGLGFMPFGNGATASSAVAGGMSVSVMVHDMAALDQAVLEEGRRFVLPPATQQLVVHKASATRQSDAGDSLADIRRQQAAAEEAEQAEARELFERGVAAYDAGKLGAAKVYFQMATHHAQGELLQAAQSRLQTLNSAGRTLNGPTKR